MIKRIKDRLNNNPLLKGILILFITALCTMEFPYSDKSICNYVLPNIKVGGGMLMLSGLIPLIGVIWAYKIIKKSERFIHSGVFLKLEADTKKLYKWYEEVLELDVTDYSLNFLKPSVLTLVTMDADATEAILNFSVDDLDGFLDKLASKGVELHKEVEVFEYGKFAQIKDIAGNIIELWEPYVDKYKELVSKEVEEYKDKSLSNNK